MLLSGTAPPPKQDAGPVLQMDGLSGQEWLQVPLALLQVALSPGQPCPAASARLPERLAEPAA